MDLPAAVLGKSIVDRLTAQHDAVLVHFGPDVFRRSDFFGRDCGNLIAALRLSAILNKEYRITSTRDVFDRITPDMVALPGLGGTALAVLGVCFEVKGIGGARPLIAWIQKHRGDGKLVTFDTIKHRDQQDAQAERKTRKTRKTSRRNRAHRLRTDRYLARQDATPT